MWVFVCVRVWLVVVRRLTLSALKLVQMLGGYIKCAVGMPSVSVKVIGATSNLLAVGLVLWAQLGTEG